LRYANVHYYRYPHSPEPDAHIFKGCYRYPFDSWIAASLKTQAGLESASTDYVFLDGDSCLLNLDQIDRAWLDGHPESDFFVLNERFSLEHSAVKENQILTFDDFEDFFVKWYWRATLYGATIVRKSLLSKFDFDHCWQTYSYYFGYTGGLFEYSSGHPTVITYDLVRFSLIPKSYSEYSTFDIWGDAFRKATLALPYFSKRSKIKAARQFELVIQKFSFKNLVRMKMAGYYGWKVYWKNRRGLSFLLGHHRAEAIVVALLPRWFWRQLSWIKQKMRRSA
jgi:hypothetical protein